MFLPSKRGRIPLSPFYRYDNYQGTNAFIAYHVRFLEKDPSLIQEQIDETGFDDNQPLFIRHGKDYDWENMMACITDNEEIYEIIFEVPSHGIFVTNDRNEYLGLFRFPVESPMGEDLCVFTSLAEDLIKKGMRWFILTGNNEGGDESFLALPSTLVLEATPLFIPL